MRLSMKRLLIYVCEGKAGVEVLESHNPSLSSHPSTSVFSSLLPARPPYPPGGKRIRAIFRMGEGVDESKYGVHELRPPILPSSTLNSCRGMIGC